jgi:hypothetical protein
LHQTSKFWSRGPYGGPRWRCSNIIEVLIGIREYSLRPNISVVFASRGTTLTKYI